MPILLILSAILSTLTGVVTGGRAPAPHVQSCAVAAETARVAAAAILPQAGEHRHLLGGFGRRSAFATSRPVGPPVVAARLYLDRLRA